MSLYPLLDSLSRDTMLQGTGLNLSNFPRAGTLLPAPKRTASRPRCGTPCSHLPLASVSA